ncbi:MAG: hypothetical protein JSW60_01045 [Thermoplasmatales archaeon]|nr:MAG: hypothetical protein JSW60_01045 [Thermoplasmatales archaeon]
MIKKSIEMAVGENKKQLLLLIVLIFILLTAFSGCVNIKYAYIPDSVITKGWHENVSLRNTGLHFLGLEKWGSSIYELKGKYPASLTVTTVKTLVLTDEEELQKKTIETLEETFKDSIQLNASTKITGERTLLKQHKTMYITYEGKDINKDLNIKLIGEIWNCGDSGTSIICIGIAYISNSENTTIENTDNWQRIVMDPSGTIENFTGEEGLIYNVYCH